MKSQIYFKHKGYNEKVERNDYSKCKIYVITSHPNIPAYYGFTTQTLSNRLLDFRHSVETGKEVHPLVKKHIMTGMETIEKVEDYPCTWYGEARARVMEYFTG